MLQPHVQTALAKGWGAIPNELDVQDLARMIEDRQPVGSHPQISVIDSVGDGHSEK